MTEFTQTKLRTKLPAAWLIILVASIAPVFLYLSCFKNSLIDDAFINLQYASNLRDHGNWGFFPDQITNTATSPLNVMLTALAGLFVPDMLAAAVWLATVEFVLLFWLLLLISRKIFDGYYFGVVSFLAILANPLLMSTIGMESLLYTLLLTACVYLFLLQRWIALAVVLALLTLTRPDGVVLFAVMFCFCSANAGKDGSWISGISEIIKRPRTLFSKQRILFCLVFALCLLPWYLFSWIHLGSLVPDTLFIKMATSSFGRWKFPTGILMYLKRSPLEIIFAFFTAPFAVLCIYAKNRRAVGAAFVLFLFSLMYYIGYSFLRPDPYHWYYVPLATACVLIGVLGVSSLYYSVENRSSSQIKTLFYVFPFLCTLGIVLFFIRAGSLSPSEAPVMTNWATHAQYKEIGLWMKDNVDASSKIQLHGEVGTIAFYSQRQLFDLISCRDNKQFVLVRFDDRPVANFLKRANFYWFKPNTPCDPYSHHVRWYTHRRDDEDFEGGIISRWDISVRSMPTGRVIFHK